MFWVFFAFNQDIKPANVFISSDLRIKLGDLGMGRFFGAHTTAVNPLVGISYYTSPECLNQSGYDFSSDIWSMGCLLYEVTRLELFDDRKMIKRKYGYILKSRQTFIEICCSNHWISLSDSLQFHFLLLLKSLSNLFSRIHSMYLHFSSNSNADFTVID